MPNPQRVDTSHPLLCFWTDQEEEELPQPTIHKIARVLFALLTALALGSLFFYLYVMLV